MKKANPKTWLVAALSVLLVCSAAANIYLAVNNSRLQTEVASYRAENQTLNQSIADTSKALEATGRDWLDTAYLYPYEDAVRYDFLLNLAAGTGLNMCEVLLTDKIIEQSVAATEISYFDYDGKLGVRVTLAPGDGTGPEELLVLAQAKPDQIKLHFIDAEDFETTLSVAQVETDPPYHL